MIRKLFFLLISCFSFVFPQTGSIKGNLIDLSGEPAELVNIILKGTTIGSVTDSKGEFLITDIPPAKYILEISHIAYKTKEISVEVTANKVTFVQDILLELKATELGEVIISHKQNKFKNLDSEYITRLNVRNIETPQSYSTTSPELLSEQNITSYTSAIQTIPGGVVSSQDPGGIVGIYLRGFLTNAYIRNGLYSLSHSGGDMQVVERLEVIKGPSSLIYGTSGISYGGLLNIVTKKPFKQKFFDAGLTFGSYNLQRFTGDFNIPFNEDNAMLFRLNVVAHSEGSFQDYGFKRSYLLAPSFYYKINNNTELFFDAELNNSKFSSPTWFIGAGALNVNQIDEIKVDYFKSYVSRDLDAEPTQLNSYYGRLNYSFSDEWKLSANVALADLNLNGSNMVPLFINDSLMVRRLFDYNGQYNTLNIHPYLTGDFLIGNFRNRMIFGIDYKWAQAHLSRFYNLNIDTINYTQDNFPVLNLNQIRMNYSTSFIEKATANNVALYISDFFSFNEQLNLMIGLRYEYTDYGGRDNQLTGNTVTEPYNQDAFSPQAGITYELIDEQLSLFANYMKGFNFVPPNSQGQSFKPEFGEQFEGGVKADIFSGILSSTISYYNINVRDKIRKDINNPLLSIQDGTQISKGIDIDLRVTPIYNLNLIAGYGYNESEFTKADANIEGNHPPGTPKHILNFWGSYTLENDFVNGFGFGVGVLYSDKYFYNDANTLVIPSYSLYKGSIFYNTSRLKITLTAENITNEKYWDYIGTPQLPRRFIASVNFRLE